MITSLKRFPKFQKLFHNCIGMVNKKFSGKVDFIRVVFMKGFSDFFFDNIFWG